MKNFWILFVVFILIMYYLLYNANKEIDNIFNFKPKNVEVVKVDTIITVKIVRYEDASNMENKE
jgi:hypothetical protein